MQVLRYWWFLFFILSATVLILSQSVSADTAECKYNQTPGHLDEPNCVPPGGEWDSGVYGVCDCCESPEGYHVAQMQTGTGYDAGKCLEFSGKNGQKTEEAACKTRFQRGGTTTSDPNYYIYPYVEYDMNSGTGWCSLHSRCDRSDRSYDPSNDLLNDNFVLGNYWIPDTCNAETTPVTSFCYDGQCKEEPAPTDWCLNCEGSGICGRVYYEACQINPVQAVNPPTNCNWYKCCERDPNDLFYSTDPVAVGFPPMSQMLSTCGYVPATCGTDVCEGVPTLIDNENFDSATEKDADELCRDVFTCTTACTCEDDCAEPRTQTCDGTLECQYSTVLCGGLNDLVCHYDNGGGYVWDRDGGLIETACMDGHDNDCDGLKDGLDPDCVVTCPGSAPLLTKQAGVCAGYHQTCDVFGNWVDDYSIVPNYEASESTCWDGLDNDCDAELDWDTQLWAPPAPGSVVTTNPAPPLNAKGDNTCRVGVISNKPAFTMFDAVGPIIAISNATGTTVTELETSQLYIFGCTSTLKNINSISLSVNGAACTTFVTWWQNISFFACNAPSAAGTATIRCSINPAKSYQLGSDVVRVMNVTSPGCSAYATQGACLGDATCKWVQGCEGGVGPRSVNNGVSYCTDASNTITYSCDVGVCTATCDSGDWSACVTPANVCMNTTYLSEPATGASCDFGYAGTTCGCLAPSMTQTDCALSTTDCDPTNTLNLTGSCSWTCGLNGTGGESCNACDPFALNACVCEPGFTDSDGDLTNGCDIQLPVIPMKCGDVEVGGTTLAPACNQTRALATTPMTTCAATDCVYNDSVTTSCYGDNAIRTNDDGRTIECMGTEDNVWCPQGYSYTFGKCTASTAKCDEGYLPVIGLPPALNCTDDPSRLFTSYPGNCMNDFNPANGVEAPPYTQSCCYDFNWTGTSGFDYNFYADNLLISEITVY